MNNSFNAEICVLSLIFKHPKTGLFVSVVECGSRQIFENSIKALEFKKVEIVFKHCESESELFEQGLTLNEGFTGTEFILGINAARLNHEQIMPIEEKTTAKIIPIKTSRKNSMYQSLSSRPLFI